MDNEPSANSPEESLEKFRSRFKDSLPEFLDNLEFLGDTPLPPNPSSLDMDDERTFEELTLKEREIIDEEIIRELGVDTQDPDHLHRQYRAAASDDPTVPGDILIQVFKTNREDVFLQRMLFRDEQFRYAVGPDMDM